MSWLELTDALNRPEEILAWFDERVREADVPIPTMSRLLPFESASDIAIGLVENLDEKRASFDGLPEKFLEAELPREEREIAWWRLVAQHTEPEHVAEIDAAISRSSRASQLQTQVHRGPEAIRQAMLARLRD